MRTTYLQRPDDHCGDFFSWDTETLATIIDTRPRPSQDPENELDISRAIRCWTCRNFFYGYDEGCGCEDGPDVEGFAIKAEAMPLLEDAQNIRQARWFHATQRGEDWLESVQNSRVLVHAGSLETARQLVLSRRAHAPGSENKPWTLFELELDPQADLAEGIRPDLETMWPSFRRRLKYDAIAYLNVYESPGDISLLVDPEKLTTVSMHTFENAAELLDHTLDQPVDIAA